MLRASSLATWARGSLGISKVYIYYALSILGFRFEAYKTAREGYNKM